MVDEPVDKQYSRNWVSDNLGAVQTALLRRSDEAAEEDQMKLPRPSWLVFPALSTLIFGCDRRETPIRTAPAESVVPDLRYQLISINADTVPGFFPDAFFCPAMVHGGTYHLRGDRWSAADSISDKCPPGREAGLSALKDSGLLRRMGDTLFFIRVESSGRELDIGRGLLHKDTLTTAGGAYGPRRVYLRRP